MPELVTYSTLCTTLGGEPSVPLAHQSAPHGQIALYFPDWAPPDRVEAIREMFIFDQWRGAREVTIILVTDVPHNRLFGDWRDAAPVPETQEEA